MSRLLQLIDRAWALFLRAANSLQSPLLLAIRLYWGWQFWQSGWGKLQDIGKVVDYFTSLGVPAPSLNAHFIAILEAGGGILLILGLGSRLIALPLVIDMAMAYVFGDREALGSIVSDPGKFYAAAPFTFLFASLLILVFGPGWLSVDALIKRYRSRRQTTAAATP
ncbi:MAG TPA: DoxX family protein [Terriglobales bacterium]